VQTRLEGEAVSGCCSEYGCRRKKPVKLIRSPLTGTWYVVTAYTERDNGMLVASTKHALEPSQQKQLETMLEAFRNWDADA
jgi:hypothetical protein